MSIEASAAPVRFPEHLGFRTVESTPERAVVEIEVGDHHRSPRGLMHGGAILGSFESVDRSPASPDPERPLLRIKGIATLGSVEIETRLIGETGRQARSREKLRRKEAYRLEKERRRLGGG